jgi:hypothetical protein
MIIKVPIYVEIESVRQEDLPDLVGSLHRMFTHELRVANFNSGPRIGALLKEVEKLSTSFKIVPRESALEYLRTSK